MEKAPAIGSTITRNGKKYRRAMSLPENGTAYDSGSYPKLSKTMRQRSAGAEYVTTPGRHYGCPIIESRRHENEMCRRHGYTRDY